MSAASSAWKHVPGGAFTTYAVRSSVDPGEVTGNVTATCCQSLVRSILRVAAARRTPVGLYSLNLKVSVAAGPRTHMAARYEPADVSRTQLGASFSAQDSTAAPVVLVTSAA